MAALFTASVDKERTFPVEWEPAGLRGETKEHTLTNMLALGFYSYWLTEILTAWHLSALLLAKTLELMPWLFLLHFAC